MFSNNSSEQLNAIIKSEALRCYDYNGEQLNDGRVEESEGCDSQILLESLLLLCSFYNPMGSTPYQLGSSTHSCLLQLKTLSSVRACILAELKFQVDSAALSA